MIVCDCFVCQSIYWFDSFIPNENSFNSTNVTYKNCRNHFRFYFYFFYTTWRLFILEIMKICERLKLLTCLFTIKSFGNKIISDLFHICILSLLFFSKLIRNFSNWLLLTSSNSIYILFTEIAFDTFMISSNCEKRWMRFIWNNLNEPLMNSTIQIQFDSCLFSDWYIRKN